MVVGSIYNLFNPISYMVLVGYVVFRFKQNNLASQKKWLSVQGLVLLGLTLSPASDGLGASGTACF